MPFAPLYFLFLPTLCPIPILCSPPLLFSPLSSLLPLHNFCPLPILCPLLTLSFPHSALSSLCLPTFLPFFLLSCSPPYSLPLPCSLLLLPTLCPFPAVYSPSLHSGFPFLLSASSLYALSLLTFLPSLGFQTSQTRSVQDIRVSSTHFRRSVFPKLWSGLSIDYACGRSESLNALFWITRINMCQPYNLNKVQNIFN